MTQENPNIALIVLDTLRKDYFDEYFDWLPGNRCDNAWSTANWTVPAHASMFTGKYASEVGIVANSQHFDYDGKFIQEELQDQGYRTVGMSANPNISPVFGADKGFDEFHGSWRLRNMQSGGFNWDKFIHEHMDDGPSKYIKAVSECVKHDSPAIENLKRGIRLKLRDLGWLTGPQDEGARDFLEILQGYEWNESHEFLFMNIMESHTPYDPPSEWKEVDVSLSGLYASIEAPRDDTKKLEKGYRQSVEYLSDIYQSIYTLIRDDFDIIITVGDHGEMLGEYGLWEHSVDIQEELCHVPFVVEGRELDVDLVSLKDIPSIIRGEPLESRKEIYTEHHGVPKLNLDSAERKVGRELPELDTRLRGIVDDGGYTREALIGRGENPGSLQEVWDCLPRVEAEENGDVPDSVRKQLEDLGYA